MSRTETAVGTPYFAPEGLINGLVSAHLAIEQGGEKFKAEPLHRPKAIFVPEESAADQFSLEVEIDPKGIQSGLNQLSLGNDGAQVIVVARIPALKRNLIISRTDVNGKSEKKIRITGDSEINSWVSLSRKSAVTISIYLVIKHQTNAGIFFPPPAGTWLAGLGFKVQPPQPSFDFTPQPLEKDDADRLRIPYDTFVYVDIKDNSEYPLTSLQDVNEALTVYVNEEVINSLTGSSSTIEARAMMVAAIRSAALSQIIFELHKELSFVEEVHWELLDGNNTLASKIIRGISDGSLTDEEFTELIRNNPRKAMAYADAELETANDLKGGM